MRTSFDCVASLSAHDLLDHFANLVDRDRRTTAELLVTIAEIDARKLWAEQACSSMFTFCMERFHMSEQVTAKRIWAARTARRFPVVLEMVARGELHLSALHLLARHLTEENHARVLERARHRSSREVERLVAELAPRAEVPSRIRALPVRGAKGSWGTASAMSSEIASANGTAAKDSAMSGPATTGNPVAGEGSLSAAGREAVDATCEEPTGREVASGPGENPDGRQVSASPSRRPSCEPAARKPIVALSPRRYRIEITVDEATHDKLRSLQDLLARSGTGRDPAAILSRAIDVLLARTLTRRAGCQDRPRTTRTATQAKAACANPRKRNRTATQANAPRTGQAPVATVKPSRADRHAAAPGASDAAASRGGRPSRYIPAAVRREVWMRDSGRCCHKDGRGRRCRETSSIEFHHKVAFAMGGRPTTQNIELRCAAHNQYQADLDFGRSYMDARREHSPGNVGGWRPPRVAPTA